jgi:epoxyqueuosine reductase QueG
MLDAAKVKILAAEFGARACGVASADRFEDAPAGFRPVDIQPACRSVVVFLKEMPEEILLLDHPIPYTHAAYQIYGELDRLGMGLCRALEAEGMRAVPVPADTPYLHWEEDRRHGMGILSLRHAAVRAGLGVMGRNNLVIHERFGNRVYLGAVLVDALLQADPVIEREACPPRCRVCLEACPVGALDGTTVDQALCRKHSFFKTPRGFDLYACNLCRRRCPLRSGSASFPARGASSS